MARPTKQGIDYFPLDCRFDEKTELLISEKGIAAIGVLIVLWQITYEDHGYYVNYTPDLFLSIRRRTMADIDLIRDIIDAAVGRGIFCQSQFSKYNILTSKAIQKRYFLASKKKKIVSVIKNYLCDGVSVDGNPTYTMVNVDGNATKEEVKEKEKEKEEVNARKQKPRKKVVMKIGHEEWFQSFYEAYPKHEAKEEAKVAWNKIALTEELFAQIMAGVERYKKSEVVQRGEMKYIKQPGPWLNGKRWEDESPTNGNGLSIANGMALGPCVKRYQRTPTSIGVCGEPSTKLWHTKPMCERHYQGNVEIVAQQEAKAAQG